MTLLNVTFTLDLRTATLPRWTGHMVQGWFLGWLRVANPELSARLHDGSGRKPYTLSPIRAISASTLRLTTLNAELTDSIKLLLSDPLPDLRLGSTTCPITLTQLTESNYEAIVREATEQPSDLRLRFITPTGFHSGGLDVPLPLPSLVFGSLIHAWESFSPLPLPIYLANFVRDHIALAYHQIRTERVVVPGHGAHLGFTGHVGFSVVRADSAVDTLSMIHLLGALVRYAEFAGVGVRTTAGMGQTGDHRG